MPLPFGRRIMSFGFYLLSKNKPMTAKAMPTIRCQDGGSRKKKMPATAMIAAPPARMAGTEESGPPLLKKQEERNCSCAYADAGEHGIENPLGTGLLIPSAGQPEKRQIN